MLVNITSCYTNSCNPGAIQETNSSIYTAKLSLAPETCEPSPVMLTFWRNITVWVNVACCDIDGCDAGGHPRSF
ncbi:unnamed protein product [Caretta caretta]